MLTARLVPSGISRIVASKLGKSWVKDQSVHMLGVDELKLHGSPWYANGTDTMRVRELLLVLLETLEEEGWTVYASIDQKNGQENYTETDTVGAFPLSIADDMLTDGSGTAANQEAGSRVHPYTIVETSAKIHGLTHISSNVFIPMLPT